MVGIINTNETVVYHHKNNPSHPTIAEASSLKEQVKQVGSVHQMLFGCLFQPITELFKWYKINKDASRLTNQATALLETKQTPFCKRDDPLQQITKLSGTIKDLEKIRKDMAGILSSDSKISKSKREKINACDNKASRSINQWADLLESKLDGLMGCYPLAAWGSLLEARPKDLPYAQVKAQWKAFREESILKLCLNHFKEDQLEALLNSVSKGQLENLLNDLPEALPKDQVKAQWKTQWDALKARPDHQAELTAQREARWQVFSKAVNNVLRRGVSTYNELGRLVPEEMKKASKR